MNCGHYIGVLNGTFIEIDEHIINLKRTCKGAALLASRKFHMTVSFDNDSISDGLYIRRGTSDRLTRELCCGFSGLAAGRKGQEHGCNGNDR